MQQIEELSGSRCRKFTAGLDTAYSSKSPDTIAMIFQGITTDRKLITLAENVINNTNLDQPIAPSDMAVRLVSFLEQCRKEWGFAKDIFVDNADQATMTELAKYKRLNGCLYNFWDAYKKFGDPGSYQVAAGMDSARGLPGTGYLCESSERTGTIQLGRG